MTAADVSVYVETNCWVLGVVGGLVCNRSHQHQSSRRCTHCQMALKSNSVYVLDFWIGTVWVAVDSNEKTVEKDKFIDNDKN